MNRIKFSRIPLTQTWYWCVPSKPMKLLFKDFLCWVGCGSWLIEYCAKCGVRQPLVWWCEDSELWMRVGNEYGALCPHCFNVEARSKGIFLRWYPRDETERAKGKDSQ